MKKISKKIIFPAITVIIIIISSILYYFAPAFFYFNEINSLRLEANLTIKSVEIPDFKIVYAEGGTGDVIIMLHGLGANKDNWLRFAKHLSPYYRVIIPDLPGFGDSSKPRDENYSILSQMDRLNLFVETLKLKKFHIIGNSIGGAIAGNYSISHPEMIKTLTFIDSAGVISPIKSKLTLLLEKGINPFAVKNEKGYDKLLEINFTKKPEMPLFIKKYLAKQSVKATPLNEKIFNDIDHNVNKLEYKLNLIAAPTLIIWGDSDKVVDVSCVSIFIKNIKNSKSAIIKDCGHLPMMEKPDETVSVYQNFLKANNN